jgi:uncharacterized protein
MDTGPLFDFHARLAPAPGAAGRLLAAMDAASIDRAAVCAGGMITLDRLAAQIMAGGHSTGDADNAAVIDACLASDGRLVPFFVGNPHADPDDYRAAAARFRGLEISPAVHGVALTDQRTVDLVEIAADHGHPVYVVCIGRPGSGAADLGALADKFPDVTFVLGHCGFIGIDLHSIGVIADRPTIWAETSGCYTAVAAAAIRRLGPDRVLFGTEYPVQHHGVEVAKLRALDLDPDVLRRVAWTNAHRLLGEEPRT